MGEWKTYNLVVRRLGLLLGLALGGVAASRGARAVGEGGGRELRNHSRVGVEGVEVLLGHLGVLAKDFALDALADVSLHLDLADGGAKDGGLAATLAFHTRSHGGEAVEALADGLATLLLGDDVVLLLLGLGEARAVVVVSAVAAVAAGRSAAGAVVVRGRHCAEGAVGIVGCCYCRGGREVIEVEVAAEANLCAHAASESTDDCDR